MSENLCRLCAKGSIDDTSLKLFDRKHRPLLTQIKYITGVMLKNSSGMPKHVCSNCTKSLNEAYVFREKVLKAQNVLKTKLVNAENKEQHYEPVIEAIEFVQVCYSKDGIHQHNIEVNNVEEREINISDSESSDKNEESFTFNFTTGINAPDPYPSGEMSQQPSKIKNPGDNKNRGGKSFRNRCFKNDDRRQIPEVSSELEKNIKLSEPSIIKVKKIAKKAISEINGVASNSRKIKPRKRRKDAEENSTVFICDQCGNNFTCRHHFKLHLRRHAGDKQCACELCRDKFFTSSELRRHMRKHTGERPFACKYCERRFTDYSTRIKHERTHTNERPFVCCQCNKSFTTSYILKNHMLTHTGERHFRCNVCDKAFTRRTHLVVHFRSIMHKQAVEKEKLPTLPEEPQTREQSQQYLFSGSDTLF